MATQTATRPTPRSSHSHSHSQSHRSSIPSLSPPARVAASVGQAVPPNSSALLRSPPGAQAEFRTPSPNYFGLVVDPPASDPQDSRVGPKDNWNPPNSSILSFGATSPQHVPLDANPDFEAFRRQTESSYNGFNLSHGNLSHFASAPGVVAPRPRPDRTPTKSETQQRPSPKSEPMVREGTADGMELDDGPGRDLSQLSSKCPSEESMNASPFFEVPHKQSPTRVAVSPIQRNVLPQSDGRHPRLSSSQNSAVPPCPSLKAQKSSQHQLSDTLPTALEDGPVTISSAQLKDIIERVPSSQFLLLDLRVFPQFSQSRIQGSLNLCIPTTLLKRTSFNLQKLQDTFTNDKEKEKFAQWKSAKYIVVYDACSSEKRDSTSTVNTLKKFSNEGWKGHSCILRGGFIEFSKNFPKLVDNRSSQDMQSSKICLSLGTQMPEVAPVYGGCMMPSTKNAANPFFSNIRQNQDLIGGVGQMDIKLPEELGVESNILPRWLSEAAAKDDHGKRVSDKFLHLELDEQSRMTKALSSGVSYDTLGPDCKGVKIAGIEKGGKNRYNNIWPFEHARVRLQGRPEGACDYVNASHIKSLRSNKRYIASQGPLPATFEDFWSVIWDHDVRVIVMLTAEKEGGQLKCHPYWASKDYGSLKLRNISEQKVSLEFKKHRTPAERRDPGRRRANTSIDNTLAPQPVEPPHAIVRKFTLFHASDPSSIREITQVHYDSWPDFGTPASPAQLLALIELSNQMQRAASPAVQPPRPSDPETDERARPMLVHCSAGCGRTGTFCTVDSVIDMLKRQRKEIKRGVTPIDFTATPSGGSMGGDYMSKGKEMEGQEWIFDQDLDLVQKTVEDFRGQRLSMVQSLRQYVLCYETVLEWMAQQTFGGVRMGVGRERSGSDGGLDGLVAGGS